MRTIVFIAGALCWATPTTAQTVNVTAHRIGSHTYYHGSVVLGSVGTLPISGTTQHIGALEYTRVQVGATSLSGTSQRVGPIRYETWSTGISAPTHATTYRTGAFSYTTTARHTYATQHVGRFRYTRGTDGTRLTTQLIGSYAYTSGALPNPRRP